MSEELASLATEAANLELPDLSQLSALEMIKIINAEDARIAGAVAQALPEIASAIEAIAERISQGGIWKLGPRADWAAWMQLNGHLPSAFRKKPLPRWWQAVPGHGTIQLKGLKIH